MYLRYFLIFSTVSRARAAPALHASPKPHLGKSEKALRRAVAAMQQCLATLQSRTYQARRWNTEVIFDSIRYIAVVRFLSCGSLIPKIKLKINHDTSEKHGMIHGVNQLACRRLCRYRR